MKKKLFKLGKNIIILFNIVLFITILGYFLLYHFAYRQLDKKGSYKTVSPMILSVKGYVINKNEREIFLKANPVGFVLREHNMRDLKQTQELVKSLRSLFPTRKILLCLDQEGGRVDRLYKTTGSRYKSAKYYGDIAELDLERAKKLLYLEAKKTATEMKRIGFDLNFAPVLDIGDADISDLGDRIYSDDINIVNALIGEYLKAFAEVGVYVTMKHIPGLGRGMVDTHDESAHIKASREDLANYDFRTFAEFVDLAKFAMVNHAIYEAIDPRREATFSEEIVRVIKEDIGYNNLLIADAFNMLAVRGYSLQQRARMSLDAGIDIIMPNQHLIGGKMEILDVITESDLRKFQERLKMVGLTDLIAK